MASVPADVVTVDPDIPAPPAPTEKPGAGDPVDWSMCATSTVPTWTGAACGSTPDRSEPMTTEAAGDRHREP
jgi:hypothetical protein